MATLFSTDELGREKEHPNEYNLPLTFFHDQRVDDVGGGGALVAFGVRPEVEVTNYPVIFDRKLSYDRIAELMHQIIQSGYVDEHTKEIRMDLVLYNTKIDLFSSIVVTGTNSLDATGMQIESSVTVLDLIVYDFKEDIVRIILEVIYYFSLFGLLLREIHELRGFIKKWNLLAGVLMYATNFGNVIDYVNYSIQIMSNLSWLSFALMVNSWKPSLTYDIFADPTDTLKYFRGGSEMKEAMQVFSDVESFNGAIALHSSLASISVVLCVIQFVKNLDFHPRMGLVSKTIGNAAGDMLFFFMLFFAVVMIYSFLGMIQYGSSVPAFSTVFQSFQTLLIMLLGEFNDYKEEMDMVSIGITTLYFWTFYVTCFFILMNAFLAIIVEAYDNTKRGFDEISYTDALPGLLRYFFRRPERGGEWRISDDDCISVCEYVLGVDSDKGVVIPGVSDTMEGVGEGILKKPSILLKKADYNPEMPRSTRALIIRKQDGDTEEDGTVTENGGRIFFGEVHIVKALMMNDIGRKVDDEGLAKIVAYNICERFGIEADVDNDGEITNEEFLNLKASARHGSTASMGFAVAAIAAKAAQLEERTKKMSMSIANQNLEAIGGVGGNLLDGAGGAFKMTGAVGNFAGNVGKGLGTGLIGGLHEVGGLADGVRRTSLGDVGKGMGKGMTNIGISGISNIGNMAAGARKRLSVRRGSRDDDDSVGDGREIPSA